MSWTFVQQLLRVVIVVLLLRVDLSLFLCGDGAPIVEVHAGEFLVELD